MRKGGRRREEKEGRGNNGVREEGIDEGGEGRVRIKSERKE